MNMAIATASGGSAPAAEKAAAMERLLGSICRSVGRGAATESVLRIPAKVGVDAALKAVQRLEVVATATRDPYAVKASATALAHVLGNGTHNDSVGQYLIRLAITGRAAEIAAFSSAVTGLSLDPNHVVGLSRDLGSASRISVAITLHGTDEFGRVAAEYGGTKTGERIKLALLGASAFSGSLSAGLAASRALLRIPEYPNRSSAAESVSNAIDVVARITEDERPVMDIAHLALYATKRSAKATCPLFDSISQVALELSGSGGASCRGAIASMAAAISINFGNTDLSGAAMGALKAAWLRDSSVASFAASAAELAAADTEKAARGMINRMLNG